MLQNQQTQISNTHNPLFQGLIPLYTTPSSIHMPQYIHDKHYHAQKISCKDVSNGIDSAAKTHNGIGLAPRPLPRYTIIKSSIQPQAIPPIKAFEHESKTLYMHSFPRYEAGEYISEESMSSLRLDVDSYPRGSEEPIPYEERNDAVMSWCRSGRCRLCKMKKVEGKFVRAECVDREIVVEQMDKVEAVELKRYRKEGKMARLFSCFKNIAVKAHRS
jgi:hypothetical protein